MRRKDKQNAHQTETAHRISDCHGRNHLNHHQPDIDNRSGFLRSRRGQTPIQTFRCGPEKPTAFRQTSRKRHACPKALQRTGGFSPGNRRQQNPVQCCLLYNFLRMCQHRTHIRRKTGTAVTSGNGRRLYSPPPFYAYLLSFYTQTPYC